MELILIILGCVMFIIVGAMLVLMFNEDQVVFAFRFLNKGYYSNITLLE